MTISHVTAIVHLNQIPINKSKTYLSWKTVIEVQPMLPIAPS